MLKRQEVKWSNLHLVKFNWGSKRLGNLPEVKQLISGICRSWTYTCLTPKSLPRIIKDVRQSKGVQSHPSLQLPLETTLPEPLRQKSQKSAPAINRLNEVIPSFQAGHLFWSWDTGACGTLQSLGAPPLLPSPSPTTSGYYMGSAEFCPHTTDQLATAAPVAGQTEERWLERRVLSVHNFPFPGSEREPQAGHEATTSLLHWPGLRSINYDLFFKAPCSGRTHNGAHRGWVESGDCPTQHSPPAAGLTEAQKCQLMVPAMAPPHPQGRSPVHSHSLSPSFTILGYNRSQAWEWGV